MYDFNLLLCQVCSDIAMHEDYFSIQIRKSKTDQYRLGDTVACSKLDSLSCPHRVLSMYIKQNHLNLNSEEYLFKPMYRSGSICSLIKKNKRLSYTRTKECIVNRLLKATNGQGNYGVHSLRAGGFTAAANSNSVLDRCWKRHGRWKSDSSKDGYVADS